jgi:hypothetical protein
MRWCEKRKQFKEVSDYAVHLNSLTLLDKAEQKKYSLTVKVKSHRVKGVKELKSVDKLEQSVFAGEKKVGEKKGEKEKKSVTHGL